MSRVIASIAIVLFAGAGQGAAHAQAIMPVTPAIGFYGGFGPYGPVAPYGAFGPYGNFATYGLLDYSQLLAQQQAALTQQLYLQRQQAIAGQIQQTQSQLQSLDGLKQQMLTKYSGMSDSDKTIVRSRLMTNYLALDDHGKQNWKRDGAIQQILGPDLPRLDSISQIKNMTEAQQVQLREETLTKYRALSAVEQKAWQSDPLLAIILGQDWWLK